MSYFDLKIVTPTKSIDFESINYVRCPGLEGLFGIMSNHQKGIFALDIGEIKDKLIFTKDKYGLAIANKNLKIISS